MKVSAIFVIAAAYGLGILTSYTFFKNRERERANEEIKSAIEHIEKRVKGSIDPEVKEEAPKEESTGAFPERNSLDSGEKSYGQTSYATKLNPVDSAETTHPTEEDESEEDERKKKAHEITMEEYFSLTGVEKKSLTWFTENNVLAVDDSSEGDFTPYGIIDDEQSILGDVLITSKFKENEWISVIYIYNPVISAAYEISKSFTKYEF